MQLITDFFTTLVPTMLVWNILSGRIFPNNDTAAFLLIFRALLLVPVFCWKKNLQTNIWYWLAVAHGLVHIYSHPFHDNGENNMQHDPLPDYLVHGLQCWTIAHYHNNQPLLQIVGILVGLSVMIGAYMVGIDRSFLDTTTWFVVSAFGVIGNHYHMMMLFNDKKTKSTFFQSLVFWAVVFSGYTIPFVTKQLGAAIEDKEWFVAFWDTVARQSGLFRIWMINFGIAVMWREASTSSTSSSSAVHGTKNNMMVAATTKSSSAAHGTKNNMMDATTQWLLSALQAESL
jgi:hypothetical protein